MLEKEVRYLFCTLRNFQDSQDDLFYLCGRNKLSVKPGQEYPHRLR